MDPFGNLPITFPSIFAKTAHFKLTFCDKKKKSVHLHIITSSRYVSLDSSTMTTEVVFQSGLMFEWGTQNRDRYKGTAGVIPKPAQNFYVFSKPKTIWVTRPRSQHCFTVLLTLQVEASREPFSFQARPCNWSECCSRTVTHTEQDEFKGFKGQQFDQTESDTIFNLPQVRSFSSDELRVDHFFLRFCRVATRLTC